MENNSQFSCNDCGKSFKRQGQLGRHALTHSNERRQTCTTCGKGFTRKDALVRHSQIHRTSTGPNLLQRGGRACLNCAIAKARCSGELSCVRCVKRALECRYDEQASSASPRQSSAMALTEEADHDTPIESREHFMQAALPYPAEDLHAPTWSTDGLSNINWLATPIMTADGYSGSFDALPWLIDDSQLWGGLQTFPFEIGDMPTVPSDHTIHRPTEDLAEALTVSTESPALSAGSPTKEAGQFYVDGSESRLPRVKRRKLSSKSGPKTATPVEISFSLSSWISLVSEDTTRQRYQISQHTYQSFRKAFAITCAKVTAPESTSFNNETFVTSPQDQASMSAGASAVFSSDLPTKDVMEYLLTLYMEHFQPTMPLFRPDVLPSSWQILLAMCALGSHFGDGLIDNFAVSMHEFMHRILHTAVEDDSWLPQTALEVAQVKLLHTIGLVYCGDERLLEYGLDLRLQALHIDQVWHNAGRKFDDWQTWQSTESAKRTAYAIWLVECMISFHFGQKSLLHLEHADTVLPCHQKLWSATTAEEWKERSDRYSSTPTLAEALQELYIEKELDQDLGDFARVLVIHGIFHRTWDVEAYYQQPLSRWSPTAQKQSSNELGTKSPVWLPSVPTYTKWRNSACDCLDILHWSANAAIGAASGMEPPHVMHLHLARVVLLTPYKHIVSLARFLTEGVTSQHTTESAAHDRQIIRKWAVQDQYKARLAMIHAGVIFWNVRRFSANGFYEPSSIALATLALWAFSAFSLRSTSRAPSNHIGHSVTREDGSSEAINQDDPPRDPETSQEEDTYDIILLDRPTDDELVQQFVRRGNFMKAYMNGVGDLHGERGAEKVLAEGRKLLSTLRFWGINQVWIRLLDKLITVTKQERENTNH